MQRVYEALPSPKGSASERTQDQLLSLLLIFLFAGCVSLSPLTPLPKLLRFQTVNDSESFGLISGLWGQCRAPGVKRDMGKQVG